MAVESLTTIGNATFATTSLSTPPDGDGTFTSRDSQYSGVEFVVNYSTGQATPYSIQVADMDGDSKTDFVLTTNGTVRPFLSSSFLDMIASTTNRYGGVTSYSYLPSSDYQNTYLPFVVQTVETITKDGGVGFPRLVNYYSYSGGFYDKTEREFRGFGNVKTYTNYIAASQTWDSMTETAFHNTPDDFLSLKGLPIFQRTTTPDGYLQTVEYTYTAASVLSFSGQTSVIATDNLSYPQGIAVTYPRLDNVTTVITDAATQTSGVNPYGFEVDYRWDDQYLARISEDKYGMKLSDEVHTYTKYRNDASSWIFSKPEDVIISGTMVSDLSSWNVNPGWNVAARKWMAYDSRGRLLTAESCKSDSPVTGCLGSNPAQSPVTSYTYSDEGNLLTKTDPPGNPPNTYDQGPRTTTYSYDDSTKTYPKTITNALGHVAATNYNLVTGKLISETPPHLYGSSYSVTHTYDVLLRPHQDIRPDGGSTAYIYDYAAVGNEINSTGTPYCVAKTEHITGGSAAYSDQNSWTCYDGFGRGFNSGLTPSSSSDAGFTTVVLKNLEAKGNVAAKSNPFYYYSTETPAYTQFSYDKLSRLSTITNPDGGVKAFGYEGLNKHVQDQMGNWTTYTSDVYKRTVSVMDANDITSMYTYDVLGNLTSTTVASGTPQQNTTTMTYNSLSQKRTMVDPDMSGPNHIPWNYSYDKNGNMICQFDAKGQTIGFQYDSLNRLVEKDYYYTNQGITCDSYSTFNSAGIRRKVINKYDSADLSGPGVTCPSNAPNCATGILANISTVDPVSNELAEDRVTGLDLMQRITKAQKTIGAANVATIAKTYDSAGRIDTITYFPDDQSGSARQKSFTYSYDPVGNVTTVHEHNGIDHVMYLDYTAAHQPTFAWFPKSTQTIIQTTYAYDPRTMRLQNLVTQQLNSNRTSGADCNVVTPISASGTVEYAYYSIYSITSSGTGLTVAAKQATGDPEYGGIEFIGGVTVSGQIAPTDGTKRIDKIVASGGTIQGFACKTWNVAGNACTSFGQPSTITLYGATIPTNTTIISTSKKYGISKITASGTQISFYQVPAGNPQPDPITYTNLGTITLNGTVRACQDINYTFDLKGNVKQVRDVINNITHDYTYDNLYRLTRATGTGTNSYDQTYAYDPLGNITCKSDLGPSGTVCAPGTVQYNYGSQPHAVQSVGNMTFAYDANGNMTQKITNGTTLNIQWNEDNMPTQVGGVQITYDGTGKRVRKGGALYFGSDYEMRGTTGVYHLYANGQRVVSIRLDGNVQYYHPDYLGSTSLVTDQSGSMVEAIQYYPFGTYLPSPPTTQGNFPKVNYTFTGQEDDDTGFYNYVARLYDPLIGRFISPDTFVPKPMNPQSFNRYSYVLNNPVSYRDPSGHEEEDLGIYWPPGYDIDSYSIPINTCVMVMTESWQTETGSTISASEPWIFTGTTFEGYGRLSSSCSNVEDLFRAPGYDDFIAGVSNVGAANTPSMGPLSNVYGDVNVMAVLIGGGYLVNPQGQIYPYYCGGLGAGISGTIGGSGFTPGETFVALQVSAIGPVAPTVQFGYGFESGFFSEGGVAAGAAYSATLCYISETPINP